MPAARRRTRAAGPKRSDSGSVKLDGRTVAYAIRRSSRRRKTIGFTIVNGELRVAAPNRTSDADIAKLVRQRADWILDKLDRDPPPRLRDQIKDGGRLPLLGGELRVVVDPDAAEAAAINGARLLLRQPDPDAAEACLRLRARDDIQQRVQDWTPIVGAEPSAVLIRAQKRRWGSAAANGALRFNWRLVFAPPEIVDYVVVHELCHLRRADHSPHYWKIVHEVMPDAGERRKRLRELSDQLEW